MRSRDEIYIDILHAGLLFIRAAGWSNNVRICEIEADHLHNIPSLIGEKNDLRHRYYFDVERMSYIERIAKENVPSELSRGTADRYRAFWEELAEFYENERKGVSQSSNSE
jgi:hypothetical protein